MVQLANSIRNLNRKSKFKVLEEPRGPIEYGAVGAHMADGLRDTRGRSPGSDPEPAEPGLVTAHDHLNTARDMTYEESGLLQDLLEHVLREACESF